MAGGVAGGTAVGTGGATARLTWAQALGRRAHALLLDPAGPVGQVPVEEVVRRLGSVPAVDAGHAELAVRTRSSRVGPGDLAAAVAEGRVVDAFAFGGGVHHLAGQEGADLLAVRTAGRQWERRSWVEHYGLAPQSWPELRAAVREGLADGPLSVPELGEALAGVPAFRHLAPVLADGTVTLVKPLTWQGDVAVAAPRDGRLTLRRLDVDDRWPGVADVEEAGPRAVLAFVGAYGPVTDAHLHHRFCEGLSAGRRRLACWVEELGERLVEVDVEGTRAVVLAEDLDDVVEADPARGVLLLPRHDAWVMGPGTADEVVTPAAWRTDLSRGAGAVVVDGVVRGSWTRRGGDLVVSAPGVEVGAASERLALLLDRELRLVRS